MSQWTHVVGCIRVDGGLMTRGGVKKIEAAIGPMCLFDEWNDDTRLPCGSEGSLQYRVIEYDTGLPWVAIPFWGDLRDYSDLEAIEKWFKDLLRSLSTSGAGMYIRDASLFAKAEYGKSLSLNAEFLTQASDRAVAGEENGK